MDQCNYWMEANVNVNQCQQPSFIIPVLRWPFYILLKMEVYGFGLLYSLSCWGHNAWIEPFWKISFSPLRQKKREEEGWDDLRCSSFIMMSTPAWKKEDEEKGRETFQNTLSASRRNWTIYVIKLDKNDTKDQGSIWRTILCNKFQEGRVDLFQD